VGKRKEIYGGGGAAGTLDFGVVIFLVTRSSASPRGAYRRMNDAQVGGRHQGSPSSLLQWSEGHGSKGHVDGTWHPTCKWSGSFVTRLPDTVDDSFTSTRGLYRSPSQLCVIERRITYLDELRVRGINRNNCP
jgi:hypothetical protein